MKKAVIFDMDGVLLNSEKLYLDMNQIWFKQIGVHISVEEHLKYVGSSATIFWEYLKKTYNLPKETDYYINMEKELKYNLLTTYPLEPTDFVVDYLLNLKQKNIAIALASSSLYKNVELILYKLKLTKYFDLVISGEQVSLGKPNPDIFLKAADQLDIKPSDCIVIEDSFNGIKAAKSAGMFCIAYFNPDSGHQDLSRADMIIDNFSDQRLYALV